MPGLLTPGAHKTPSRAFQLLLLISFQSLLVALLEPQIALERESEVLTLPL